MMTWIHRIARFRSGTRFATHAGSHADNPLADDHGRGGSLSAGIYRGRFGESPRSVGADRALREPAGRAQAGLGQRPVGARNLGARRYAGAEPGRTAPRALDQSL